MSKGTQKCFNQQKKRILKYCGFLFVPTNPKTENANQENIHEKEIIEQYLHPYVFMTETESELFEYLTLKFVFVQFK